MPAPTTTDATDVRERAEAHLRALVGPRDGQGDAVLYDDQWAAISALAVDRRRALVVQRTGWGKSAVYFVATLLLREQGAGPTVIVSPLLALMRNQIAAAERAGIRAVTINSTNIEEWEPVQQQILAGEVDVLLVSPERLNNPGFRDQVLPRLAATCGSWSWTRRTASPTGATTSAPTTGGSARCSATCPTAYPSSPPPPPPTPG